MPINENPVFRPVLGTEEQILSKEPINGHLYFATDTKKIFYGNLEDNSYIPMGGNFGLYYGNKVHDFVPDEGQVEFDFSFDDLIPTDNISMNIAPGDLILNSDGSFYKVISIEDDTLSTNRITISGSGGGPAGSVNIGKMELSKVPANESFRTILLGQPCLLGFSVTAVDAGGESTGDGSVRVTINKESIDALSGVAKQMTSNSTNDYVNYIDISPYITDEGDYEVTFFVEMDTGGSALVTQKKTWKISAKKAELTWDYKEETINLLSTNLQIEWTVSGENIDKYLTVKIDDYEEVWLNQHGTETDWTLTINKEDFPRYNLTHGVHTIKIEGYVRVGGTEIPLISKKKNFILVDPDSNVPIINCLSEGLIFKQYNTTQIPVIIYSKGNEGNESIRLLEGQTIRGEEPNAENGKIYFLRYTPLVSGEQVLNISYSQVSKILRIEIEGLNIQNAEVPGYAFKFQASNFMNNEGVKTWNFNGVTADFSNNFDWINGGLQSEVLTDNTVRSFLRIKAGDTMTINHALFSSQYNAKLLGKVVKIIFRATNCRDYDGQVLSCKKFRQIPKIHNEEGMEEYLDIEENTVLQYSSSVNIENNKPVLYQPETIMYNINNSESREALDDAYILFEENIYKCKFKKALNEDGTEVEGESYYAEFYLVEKEDSFTGLSLNAQSATFNSVDNTLSTQYCEDTYIELELDIGVRDEADIKNYIKFWIDGIPSGFIIYGGNDSFVDADNNYITIGSEDCDVDLYMIKVYNKELTIDEHISNFIADAPNAEEMIKRYNRNDIMVGTKKDSRIDLKLLAEKNPNCLIHEYHIDRMSKKKDDPIVGCSYKQYLGNSNVKYKAEGVMIKVQGTSSEKYVTAAANLDTDFQYFETLHNDPAKHPTGLINTETNQVLEDGWSMDTNALPINYACTKVNVASCENANNALNQEWYNLFQPYPTVLRCKNPKARDTMQFTNGVIFIKDSNPNSLSVSLANKADYNVFAEIDGYIQNPYSRFYSIGQMGNSKDNTHVFHDTENPLECCIEVKDNQTPQQWMISDEYEKGSTGEDDIGENQKFFEFRYPKKLKSVKKLPEGKRMIKAWNDFVSWMARCNPSARYAEHKVLNIQDYNKISYNPKTKLNIPVYILNSDRTAYIQVERYDPNIEIYYTETQHKTGYTNLKLDISNRDLKRDYGDKKFGTYKVPKTFDENGEPLTYWQDDLMTQTSSEEGEENTFKSLVNDFVETAYNFRNFIERDENGDVIENYIADETGYTYDTYQYRMARMLDECEDHLVMDSVIYHYLFIEKHCMIDNVAKNTFWSTEDCQHWNLTKDYDNDTADGNDNNGTLTRTYGIEALDKIGKNSYSFNAHQSVWFNFIHGLYNTCSHVYDKLDKKTVVKNGKTLHLWRAQDYLDFFEEWQSRIPERCWIEDYYRKYFRPYEILSETRYINMLQGGPKKYQRKQFEIYQDTYMDSKYQGTTTSSTFLWFRPQGTDVLGAKLPIKTYSDCYIHSKLGSDHFTPIRAKRNVEYELICPQPNAENATFDIYPANAISSIGNEDHQLNDFSPASAEFTAAKKLRKLIFAKDKSFTNNYLKSGLVIAENPLLEELYLDNLSSYQQGLDLKFCPSLKILQAKNSSFSSIEIADHAPVESIVLEYPTSLTLSNLYNLKTLSIKDYSRLTNLYLNNIDHQLEMKIGGITQKTDSQFLINNSPNLSTYDLLNVKWTLTNPGGLTENADGSISVNILNRLLGLNTMEIKNNDGTTGYKPKALALTGQMLIDKSAYNGNKSFDIYTKYSDKDDAYPNLELQFNGENSILYNVTILNGNGKILWQKKILPGSNVDGEFLSDGPSGAFDPSNIYKSSDSDKTYQFNSKWLVNNSTNELSGEYPSYTNVQSDITFTPLFTPQVRTFTVKFFDEDTITQFATNFRSDWVATQKVPYGTKVSDIYPLIVPYKNSSNLSLYEVYGFKGYGKSADSRNKTVIPDDYTIIQDEDFYAKYAEPKSANDRDSISVYGNIINPIYLDADANNRLKVRDETERNEAEGWTWSRRYVLKGKVTLPNTFNGQPVTGIATGGFSSASQITHVFWQPSTTPIVVGAYAFQDSLGGNSLKYYEITDNLTHIETQAFDGVKFEGDMTVIKGENLISIGAGAFKSSFKNYFARTNNYYLEIGGNIKTIGNLAFATNAEGMDRGPVQIIIGDETTPWCSDIGREISEGTLTLGSNLFNEASGTLNLTYGFTIYSGLDFQSWKNLNGAIFEEKLGLQSSTVEYR